MDLDGSVRLLGVILAGAPSLPGAACRGRHELYDEATGRDPERHVLQRQRLELAAELCCTCPARPACPASVAASAA